MFEKEAEEYAKQNNPAEYGVRATHFTVLNSFKDGAEYGYNKAKEELKKESDGLKARLNAINLLTPELEKQSRAKKKKIEYAKTIIQDLLSNSDEYARQRAIDFIKGK